VSAYAEFLASKEVFAPACGFDVPLDAINPMLRGDFAFQADIVRWALKRGKAAIFAHTGLGKGPMQLEWARQVSAHTQRNVLLLAPLAVSQQFKGESQKFGIPAKVCQNQSEVQDGITITNYERLDQFDISSFISVAMDESSCIKDWTSKTTQTLIEKLKDHPFKLCSTATPSPNDHSELGTHAELLDVMKRSHMLAMFFEHDGGETSKWVLKGHGRKPFFKFVASWAVCLQKPSDLGYPDEKFILPPLNIIEHIVKVDQSVATDGMLFRCPDLSATGLHKEMRLTCGPRAEQVAQLIEEGWQCGNKSTRSLDAGNGKQIQNTQNDASSNEAERQPRTDSTCETITPPINPSGLNPAEHTGTRSTQDAAQCTPATQKSEQNSKPPLSDGNPTIQISGSTSECDHTDSPGPTTGECLQTRTGNAPSAVELIHPTSEAADSMSITAIQPAESGDCCVPTATLQSASSRTIQRFLGTPSGTSQLPQWIVWCNTDYEQEPLEDLFGDLCISIRGSMSPERKESGIMRWLDAERPILLTKPSVAGYGLNFQNCHNVAFVGLSYSFEDMFQAIRRCWRFGQTRPVDVHIVIAETEGPVLQTIRRKEAQYEELQAEMNTAMREEQLAQRRPKTKYEHAKRMKVPEWLIST
jgi:hypothetical protein